jgi:predicted acylesterase/phospholipase RssA
MDAKTKAADRQEGSHGWRPERCDRIALVLQGGGALGAYQAGVYQALHEANIQPDWVSGVSIGAINSAIIAGNPPEVRLARLQAFWERITDRRILGLHAGWRHLQEGAQCHQRLVHHDPGPARFLRAAASRPLVFADRRPGCHQLLRHRAVARDPA